MKVSNKEALDNWMQERMQMGRDLIAIKGDPPQEASYSDGEIIKNPINIAWKDIKTGEVFGIEYEI